MEHKIIGKTIRRILPHGNSVAVTLPHEYIKAHGLKTGDSVEVIYNEILRIEPVNVEKLLDALGEPKAERRRRKLKEPLI